MVEYNKNNSSFGLRLYYINADKSGEDRKVKKVTDFEGLKKKKSKALLDMGCKIWDIKNGKALMLFPVEWYKDIPRGYELETISGDIVGFKEKNSNTTKEEKFGVLPYGIRVKNNIKK